MTYSHTEVLSISLVGMTLRSNPRYLPKLPIVSEGIFALKPDRVLGRLKRASRQQRQQQLHRGPPPPHAIPLPHLPCLLPPPGEGGGRGRGHSGTRWIRNAKHPRDTEDLNAKTSLFGRKGGREG